MIAVRTLDRVNGVAQRATRPLAALLLLATRAYVAWQFLKSGWLKLQDWDTTLFLFQEEYRVPLLSPGLAALAGTAGELAFPTLLILGLGTRLAALGVSAVNVLAVVSYAHVLLAAGSAAALGQHVLWGYMLLVVLVFGAGPFSLDALVARSAQAAGNSPTAR